MYECLAKFVVAQPQEKIGEISLEDGALSRDRSGRRRVCYRRTPQGTIEADETDVL